jgi:polyisoprenoid-binding protein YceI
MQIQIRVITHRLAAAVILLSLPMGAALAADTAAAPAMPPPAPPPAGEYQLDKSHASLLFRVSHLGFSTYTSRFSRFDAKMTFDPNNMAASSVVVTIDPKSLEMDAAPLVCIDIVQGPQLLDTAKFPEIVFRSDQIRMTGNKSMQIHGTLQLHGVTRPLTLTATYNGGYPGMANMDPNARVGFSAQGSFNRSDFGMSFGLPPPGTSMGLGDSINITIEAEFSGPPLSSAKSPSH